MAQTKCTECGIRYKKENTVCPNCGCPTTINKGSVRKRNIIIICSISTIFVVMIALIFIMPAVNYHRAISYAGDGNYEKAISVLENNNSYKESDELKVEYNYELANQEYEEGDYEGASYIFRDLGEYKDSEDLYMLSSYQEANLLAADQQYHDAIEILKELGEYKDCKARLSQYSYTYAEQLLRTGDYEQAIEMYKLANINDYEEKIELATVLITRQQVIAQSPTVDLNIIGVGDSIQNFTNEAKEKGLVVVDVTSDDLKQVIGSEFIDTKVANDCSICTIPNVHAYFINENGTIEAALFILYGYYGSGNSLYAAFPNLALTAPYIQEYGSDFGKGLPKDMAQIADGNALYYDGFTQFSWVNGTQLIRAVATHYNINAAKSAGQASVLNQANTYDLNNRAVQYVYVTKIN